MTETDNQRGSVCNHIPARSGVSCIGRMGGGDKDWFASVMYQLHFAQLIMLAGIEKWRADREEKRRG